MDKSQSFLKNLMCGRVLENNIFPYPAISDEQSELIRMVIESVDRFMENRFEEFRDFDVKGEQSAEFIQQIKEVGLFSLIIPEEYEGLGLGNAGYSRIIQQITRYDGSSALTVGAHSSIGMKGLLLYGNAEQKNKYLPKLASGEMIAAFCLTEPSSGSDAASIKTVADKNEAGDWVLNGEKIWITNGPMAGFFTVFARTDKESNSMTAFIVDSAMAGVRSGPKEDKMGIRGSATSSIFFDNVVVPKENVLGEVGKGFKVAMAILNNGRTGLGGGCVGAMKRVINLSASQANTRKQFGQKISDFRLIKEKLAKMTVDCYVSESLVNLVCFYIDNDFTDYSTEAAASKIFATESLWSCANEGLQIAGGNGFMREYPYEMIVRDSRINMIFEGTNEILRLFVALGGIKKFGKELKNVKPTNIKSLAPYLKRRFGMVSSISSHPELADMAKFYVKSANELANSTEYLLKKHKKNIVTRQYQLRRLADSVIYILSGLATLSRVSKTIEEKGAANSKHEIEILKIYTSDTRAKLYGINKDIRNNHDEVKSSLADYIFSLEDFPWDVV